jgi:hypothetical protein
MCAVLLEKKNDNTFDETHVYRDLSKVSFDRLVIAECVFGSIGVGEMSEGVHICLWLDRIVLDWSW